MRLRLERRAIYLYPESVAEVAYVEEVLGLRTAGQTCEVKRENVVGTGELACLKIEKKRCEP
jgi:hypothetical protein